MKFSIKWLDSAKNAAVEERATVGRFYAYFGDVPATLNLRGKEARDYVRIALYGIVEGLAHDWWSIFGGRHKEFSLRHYRSGYLVPDLRFYFDGSAFEIHCPAFTYPGTTPDHTTRFQDAGQAVLSRKQAEDAFSGLIEEVLARLDGQSVPETSAHRRWTRVRQSRLDPDESAFCELAGALGLDPYRVDDGVAGWIETAAALFEGEARNEAFAGTRPENLERLVSWVRETETRSPDESAVSDLKAIATQVADAAPRGGAFVPAWSLGYRRARAMRRVLDLSESQPVADFQALARTLGAGSRFQPALAAHGSGLRAMRTLDDGRAHIHVPTLPRHLERHLLFNFARAVGDIACFPDAAGRAVVNEAGHAYRQASGRAFAAEFLAPVEHLCDRLDSGEEPETLADSLGVDFRVVQHQVDNQDRIREACCPT
jgi:hypothetical protein